MIVYNVTVKVTWNILEEWLVWELEEQIPAVLATRLFDDYKFFRLLEQDEEDGPTFIIQYFTASLENYRKYITEYAPALQEKGRNKWGEATIAFQTLMSSLDTGF